MDKTGTLTQGGNPVVTDYQFIIDMGHETILGMVRSLENNSSHSLARVVVLFCNERPLDQVQSHMMEELAGKGVRGRFSVGNDAARTIEIIVGNKVLMHEYNVIISSATTDILN
jgi:P-type Cu+ transporter